MDVVCAVDIDYKEIKFGFSRRKFSGKEGVFLLSRRYLPYAGANSLVDEALCTVIKEEFSAVEKKYNCSITGIILCLNPDNFYLKEAESTVVINPKFTSVLTRRSLKDAVEQAKLLSINWDKKILFSAVKEVFVDGRRFYNLPLGVYARKVKVKAVFFLMDDFTEKNIELFSERIDTAVESIVIKPLCYVSSLEGRRLKQKFALIDVRWKSVDIAVFDNFSLKDFYKIPKGLLSVESSVCGPFNIPKDLFWQVVDTYGLLSKESLAENKNITLKVNGEYRHINKGRFLNSLAAGIKNIFLEAGFYFEKETVKPDFCLLAGEILRIGRIKEFAGRNLSRECFLPQDFRPGLTKEQASKFLPVLGCFSLNNSPFSRDILRTKPKNFWERLKYIYEEYF